MRRGPEYRPLQAVVGEPVLRSGRGSVLGGDTNRRTRWWVLELACGHQVERFVSYVPPPGPRRRVGARSVRDVLPAPRRARCDECPAVGSAP